MFSIFDGRESFYQWDLDRKVIVDDESIKQVHFCNRTDDCSLVVDTYKDGNLTVADVPNILLQENFRINVYAFDSQYTKFSKCFNVIKRSKPASYVYTETEIKTFSLLEEKMQELENTVSVDGIAQAVKEYLQENPVEAGATAAEAAQIAQNAKDIGTLKADSANYALKKDIPSIDGLASEKYVNDAIGAIEIPKTDLTNYATKQYVDNAVNNVDIPVVPSKISAFTNDSGYQTAAQVESIVDAAISGINVPSGGTEKEWVLITDTVLTEAAHSATFTQLPNGEAFGFSELMVYGASVCNVGTTVRAFSIKTNGKFIAQIPETVHKVGTDISEKLFFYKGIIENGIINGIATNPASSAQQINGRNTFSMVTLVDFEKINSVGVEPNSSAEDFGAGTWFKIYGR